MMKYTHMLACALLLLAMNGYAHGADKTSQDILKLSDGTLAINVLGGETTVEWRAAQLVARTITQRTGIDVPVSLHASAQYTLILGKRSNYGANRNSSLSGLKNDGFYINSQPDKRNNIYVIGDSSSGVMAGQGNSSGFSNMPRDVSHCPYRPWSQIRPHLFVECISPRTSAISMKWRRWMM